MKRHLWVAMVIVGAMAAMSLNGERRPPSGNRSGTHVSAAVGNLAPDFRLSDVRTGKSVQLSDFKGKGVLVNFWATWCPACKVETSWFIALQKIHAAEGFQVIGIAVDDTGADAIAKFADDMNVNYPVLQGTEKVAGLYGVSGLPVTFLIGRDGRVVKQVLGEPSRNDLENTVKAMLRSDESDATQAAEIRVP